MQKPFGVESHVKKPKICLCEIPSQITLPIIFTRQCVMLDYKGTTIVTIKMVKYWGFIVSET